MTSSTILVAMPPKPENNRKSAGYHPSVWGDYFISCASDSKVAEKNRNYLKLKEEVRKMLANEDNDPMDKLYLIDSIQRLGVAYHFVSEIHEILRIIYRQHLSIGIEDTYTDLYTVAIKFRLLRQHRYKISSDIFKQFKDGEGNFKVSLTKDPRGLLSLFEASHLRIHREDILDEALEFTTAELQSVPLGSISSYLAAQINHALKQPLYTGLQRLEARCYFPIYEQDPSRNDVLLTFAKMDFNILQNVHQKELSVISKWWKELDLLAKLPFIRDRIVECYFWILGVYFEPEYALSRGILTRVITMISVLDDIYDVHGTPEELELFTAAVERWDMAEAGKLREYMKIYYTAWLGLYQEIEDEMTRQGKLYQFHYAREAAKNQAKAYFEESKLLNRQDVPTIEEYMELALRTTGYHALAITSFVGMGNDVTKDAFEWITSYPKIIKATDILARLMDDIGSYKFERERDHIASSIECYAKQYGVTEAEAICELNKQVINAWKDFNEECLYLTAVPMPLLTRILNLVRVLHFVYKNGDGYTHSSTTTKDAISSLLIEPVPV